MVSVFLSKIIEFLWHFSRFPIDHSCYKKRSGYSDTVCLKWHFSDVPKCVTVSGEVCIENTEYAIPQNMSSMARCCCFLTKELQEDTEASLGGHRAWPFPVCWSRERQLWRLPCGLDRPIGWQRALAVWPSRSLRVTRPFDVGLKEIGLELFKVYPYPYYIYIKSKVC